MEVDLSRRSFLGIADNCHAAVAMPPLMKTSVKIFDVLKYGVRGDGKTLDGPLIQGAIDEAVAYGSSAQVLVRGGRKYLIGTLELRRH